MLIPSDADDVDTSSASLSRGMNANSQRRDGSCGAMRKSIKRDEC